MAKRHYHIVRTKSGALGTTTRVEVLPDVFTNRREAEQARRGCEHYEPDPRARYKVSWHWPNEKRGIHF